MFTANIYKSFITLLEFIRQGGHDDARQAVRTNALQEADVAAGQVRIRQLVQAVEENHHRVVPHIAMEILHHRGVVHFEDIETVLHPLIQHQRDVPTHASEHVEGVEAFAAGAAEDNLDRPIAQRLGVLCGGGQGLLPLVQAVGQFGAQSSLATPRGTHDAEADSTGREGKRKS